MEENTKYIEDLSEFVKDLSESENNKLNVFRGQSDSEWKIVASIFRGKHDNKKERYIFNKIKKYNSDELSNKDSYLDELIDMQHYGVPTRLLDWSYNPLTALYFAVAYDAGKEGCVFMLQVPKHELISFGGEKYMILSKLLFEDVTKEVLSFDSNQEEIKKIIIDIFEKDKKYFFIDTAVANKRIKAQQGCFLLTLNTSRKYFDYAKEKLISNLVKLKYSDEGKSPEIDNFIKDLNSYYSDNNLISKDENDFIKGYVKFTEEVKQKFISSFFPDNYEEIKGLSEYRDIVQGIDNVIGIHIVKAKEIFLKYNNEILGKIKKPEYGYNSKELVVYRIKAENKLKLKQQLEKIGITPMSIYPDLKGTIEHINNKYK